MHKKLLYILVVILGTSTFATGYLINTEKKSEHIKEKNQTEQKIVEEKNTRQLPATKIEISEADPRLNSVTPTSPPVESDTIHQEEKFEAKVEIQIEEKKLYIPYHDNMTAEDAMEYAEKKYPESFWYEAIPYGGDLGTFVKSITGKSENYQEKMHWILYINGKKSNKGISTLILNSGDVIKWNYEKEIL